MKAQAVMKTGGSFQGATFNGKTRVLIETTKSFCSSHIKYLYLEAGLSRKQIGSR